MEVHHEQTSGAEAAPEPREIEWQLEGDDLATVERWLLAGASIELAELGLWFEARPPVLNRDTYLETADGAVGAADSSARIRSSGGARELTVKTGASTLPGVRDRVELTQPLEPGADLRTLHGPVGDRLRELAAGEPLVEQLSLETLRRRFDAVSVEGTHAEIALDEVHVLDQGVRSLPFRRIEVEAKGPSIEAARTIAERLRACFALVPAHDSKLERARAIQRAATAGALPPPTAEVDGSMSTGELARIVAGRNLAALLQHAPGVLRGDVEAVHQARVSIRRTRAALSLFRDVLPGDARAVSEELALIATALGDVRDLDVQTSEIARMLDAGGDDLTAVLALLGDQRAAAHRRARATFDAPRSRAAIRHAAALVGSPVEPHGPSARRARRAAPSLIAKRYAPVARDARAVDAETPPDHLHELRLRCKRLRYTVEFFAPLYPDTAADVVRRLAVLQDALGAQQDAVVATERLGKLAEAIEPGRLASQLGRIAERYAASAAAARPGIERDLRRFRRGPWRRLADDLAQG